MPEQLTYTYRATREAVNIYYVYHFPIFIFIIQITGLVFIAIVFAIVKLYLFDYGYFMDADKAEQERNLHLVASPLGFVFLTGEGILIFRICRNIKTWQVRVAHIVLHVAGLVIGVYGIASMYKGKDDAADSKTEWQKTEEAKEKSGYSTIYAVNPHHVNTVHPALGYFAVATLGSQFLSGVGLMFLSVNSLYVDMVSEIHGFMGVFTLITTSITAICGVMTKMNDKVYFKIDKYYEFDDEYKIAFGAVICCLIFTWGIIYIVINPHFEWVKIGPL